MSKNKVLQCTIVESHFPNKSIGYTESGKVIKIKGGIVGQKVKVKKIKEKKDEIKAKLIEVLEESPLEGESKCIHQHECGGCTYQKMTYEEELQYKKEQLENLFRENKIVENLEISPSPNYTAYRNKMEYTFGDEYMGSPLSLGLHKKGKFHEIVNTIDCNIVHRDFNIVREGVRNYFNGRNSFYNRMKHKGFLRHLVVRRNSKGQMLINLSTSTQESLNREEFVQVLLGLNIEGKIISVYHTKNDGLADAVIADTLELIYGSEYMEEEILGLKFKIGPFSFFQTNTQSAEKLYEYALKLAGDNREKIIYDLYSGTGTIAQIMSKGAKKVVGIEIVEEAVESARESAKTNRLNNVKFICGDVFEKVEELKESPHLIILDPPRDGIHSKAIGKIINFSPKEFIYISCNPTTMARDLVEFKKSGYEIKEIKAVDQFPRTVHVETVVLLTKKQYSVDK